MNAKRTPEEILRSIEEPTTLDEELDAELESVLAMSPEQRRAELEAAGFDMKELHAKADAFAEKLGEQVAAPEKKTEEPTPRPKARPRPPEPEPRRLPPVVWFAAATVAAAAAGGLVYAMTHPSTPPPVPSPPAPSSAPAPVIPSQRLIAASDMRRRALAECEASRWAECIARFDEARMMDPAGDQAPEVQAAREKASHELERKEPKAPGRPPPP